MWFKIGMSTNPSNPVSELLQLARDYQHNPNQNSILGPFKKQVLLLRAKYATYVTITEILDQNSVKVSEATVRRFCRRYYVEIEHLRKEMDKGASGDRSAANVPMASTGSSEGPLAGEDSLQTTEAKSSIDSCSMAAVSSPGAVSGVQIVEGVVHIWFPLETLLDHRPKVIKM
jgi:hypothetical protein